MTASVITNASNQQVLVLNGSQTGVSYNITDNSGSNSTVAGLGIAPVTTAAQAATGTIDGVAFQSASNTITALQDVSINALSTGNTTLTIGQNTNGIVSAVQDFISKYNAVVGQINQNNTYNSTTKQAGVFLGDNYVAGLQNTMSNMIENIVDPTSTGTSSGIESAADIGITVQKDGTLSLDQTKLTQALATNPQQVYQIIAAEPNSGVNQIEYSEQSTTLNDGIANRINAYIDSQINNGSLYNPVGATAGFSGAMSSLQTQITDYTNQINDFEQMMTIKQQTLTQEFTNMETSVSKWRNQGNYLSSQFASMSSGSTSSSSGIPGG